MILGPYLSKIETNIFQLVLVSISQLSFSLSAFAQNKKSLSIWRFLSNFTLIFGVFSNFPAFNFKTSRIWHNISEWTLWDQSWTELWPLEVSSLVWKSTLKESRENVNLRKQKNETGVRFSGFLDHFWANFGLKCGCGSSQSQN